MDHRSTADSSLIRSAGLVGSGNVRSASRKWKPTEAQKRILRSYFTSGMKNPPDEEIYRITAELQKHGPVEGKNVFFWFQNTIAKDKQMKKEAQSSSTGRSVSDKSSVQEQDVDSISLELTLGRSV